MDERVPVIINAHAGSKYDTIWADDLADRFKRAGVAAIVTLARDGAHILETARAAVAAKAPIVVAGGGDGTINAVASIIVESHSALGILPLGTLNHFAKDLSLPLELDAAIAIIAAGHGTHVDTGEVNGQLFLNNSSLGLYPDIVRSRERQQRSLGRGKWRAFASATLTALRRYPFLTARLEIDGAQHSRRTPFIFIGNNEYLMRGFTPGARKTLTAGKLSIYVVQRTSRLGLIRLALRSLIGRLRQAGDFDALSASDLLIETRRRRLPVATDGEVNWMRTPLRYRIRPRSLHVIVPAPVAVDGDTVLS